MNNIEDIIINKYHKTVQKSVAEEIFSFNLKIKFKKPTFVIKEVCKVLPFNTLRRYVAEIDSVEFGVKYINHIGEHFSNILVWSDGVDGGYRCWFINVPNELFEVINE
jgi:hypothetical protein